MYMRLQSTSALAKWMITARAHLRTVCVIVVVDEPVINTDVEVVVDVGYFKHEQPADSAVGAY